MFPKIKLWYMYCSTGCTCCSNENFYQGFYTSKERAEEVKTDYLQGKSSPLASQYAKYGRYNIYECEAELLPDGRMIVDGKVFEQDSFTTWYD